MYYYNPSRTAVIWDARNNQHIQPGGKSTKMPYETLVRTGQLLKVDSDNGPVTVETSAPIIVTSSLVLDEVPKSPTVVPKGTIKNKKSK